MSVRCIDWAIKESKNHEPAHQLVLLALANFANNAGEAWPSTATLARVTRLSGRSVQRATKQLLLCGDILSMTPGGGRRSNLYIVPRSATGAGAAPRDSTLAQQTGQPCQDGIAAAPDSQGTPVTLTADPSYTRHLNNQRTHASAEEGFDRFWTNYPRKDAKQAALAEWTRIAPDVRVIDEIIAAVQRHAATKQWAAPTFIPYASTFLKQARWMDGPAAGAAGEMAAPGRSVPDVEATQEYLADLRNPTR